MKLPSSAASSSSSFPPLVTHPSSPHKLDSPSSPSSHSTPRSNRTANKIMSSVRRSVSAVSAPKRRQIHSATGVMYSTPEERDSSALFHHDRSPPTIEQIAMGLHMLRTPHMRPRYPYSQRPSTAPHSHHSRQYTYPYLNEPHSGHVRQRSATSSILPPPPTRSSLKKASTITLESSPGVGNPGLSASIMSASSTTGSSNISPTQSNRSLAYLKIRMSRFLPGFRTSSSTSSSGPSSMFSSPSSSPGGSTAEFHVVKKAVRFSTSSDDDYDDE